jgi:hypothetical protein
LEEIIFENFNISENNIISVELAKVRTRVCMCVHCVENFFAENPLFHFFLSGFKFQLCYSHAYNFIGLAYQGKDIVFRFIIEYIVASWILAPNKLMTFMKGMFIFTLELLTYNGKEISCGH